MEQEPHPEHAQLEARIEQLKELLSRTTEPLERERLIDALVEIAERLRKIQQDGT